MFKTNWAQRNFGGIKKLLSNAHHGYGPAQTSLVYL